MRESNIKDGGGVIVKEGDKVSFIYGEDSVVADIKFNNGNFIVASPNNIPLSCCLQDLKNHTNSFMIIN